MAKLVFGMNQSLDGYVDHLEMRTGPALFRHWIEHVRGLTGSVYGRRLYEVMRYWDEDHPEWDAAERDFAAAWRSQPKWVVSRALKSVGPNATLVADEIEAVWKMIQRHQSYTHSARAASILATWQQMIPKFVKVMPKDYKRMLQHMRKMKEQGLSGEDAVMAAFEANARDEARIGGG